MNFFKEKLPYLPEAKVYGSEIEWNEMSITDDTVSFLFTIRNYSHLIKKNGESVESSKFSLKKNKNMKWYMKLFPKGCKKQHENSISLFLHRDFENPLEVKATYFIAILAKNDNNVEMKGNNVIFKRNDGWGSPELIDRNELLQNKDILLPDDTLTIFCSVSACVNVETKLKTVKLKKTIEKSEIIKRFKLDKKFESNDIYQKCYADDSFSDITLIVDKKELKAHKVFLSAASPIFASILNKDTNSITVAGISYEVMQQMLHFIYTEKIDDLQNIAHELIAAADKYRIEALKIKCELSLCERISLDNVLKIIVIADENDAKVLKKVAVEFIIKNKQILIKNPDFKKIFELRPHLYELIFWSEVESSNN